MIWHRLLCDWYICQCLCMKSSNEHIFITGKRGPWNNICTTSYPFYGNERHVILWQKRTNRHRTSKQACGGQKAADRSELNGNGPLWWARKLSALLHDKVKKELRSSPTRCLLAFLIIFHDNIRLCWLLLSQMLTLNLQQQLEAQVNHRETICGVTRRR